MSKDKANLLVGTSGWSYNWENFYPENLASKDRLSYYSQHFKTTEVNSSFYHLPRKSTYEKWLRQTPADFIFALKLSRYISHIKRLSEIDGSLELFLERSKILGSKLGPILVQLAPSFKLNPKILENFLKKTEKIKEKLKIENLRLAFEFRHKSWFEEGLERKKALRILKKFKASFVFAHSSRYPYPKDEPQIADFIYLRFHGPRELFASEYRKEGLEPWLPKIKNWLKDGLDVYAYFNNDFFGFAVKDAKALLDFFSS